jgi:hypothetical protein
MRAHGAWVYLFACVAAGALVDAGSRVEPAMLVGTGVIGAFLLTAAVSVGVRRKKRQLLTGASLVAIAPLMALCMDAKPVFLVVAALAVLPAGGAVVLQKKLGFLSRSALTVGIAAIALAAPIVAVAGGSSVQRGALLFVLLWLFFSWRTLRIAMPLAAGTPWHRAELRSFGLREAGIAAVWILTVTFCLRAF